MICDAGGYPMGFVLLPGQTGELKAAPLMLALAVTLGQLLRVVCDRAYASEAWRDAIRAVGAEPIVPVTPAHVPTPHDRAAYRRRHKVENLWARLKEWRAIATRLTRRPPPRASATCTSPPA